MAAECWINCNDIPWETKATLNSRDSLFMVGYQYYFKKCLYRMIQIENNIFFCVVLMELLHKIKKMNKCIHALLVHQWVSKNIDRHTAHTIFPWPNPKQSQFGHSSDLMMTISPTHSPMYCLKYTWGIDLIIETQSTDCGWQLFHNVSMNLNFRIWEYNKI